MASGACLAPITRDVHVALYFWRVFCKRLVPAGENLPQAVIWALELRAEPVGQDEHGKTSSSHHDGAARCVAASRAAGQPPWPGGEAAPDKPGRFFLRIRRHSLLHTFSKYLSPAARPWMLARSSRPHQVPQVRIKSTSLPGPP